MKFTKIILIATVFNILGPAVNTMAATPLRQNFSPIAVEQTVATNSTQELLGPYGPTCGLILGANYQEAQYNCGVASQGAGQLTNCSFNPSGQVSCRCCWQNHF